MTIDLSEVLDEPLDWQFKSFPVSSLGDRPLTIRDVPNAGWNALSGDLTFPLLVLKEAALQHNINLLSEHCRRNGVSLAPHIKTPVAPQIAARQLAAGAWGISAATFHQVRLFRRLGVARILLANQLVERGPILWIADEITADPSFDFMCLVDSVDVVEGLDGYLKDHGFAGHVKVLIELGVDGGRCGCRSVDEAVSLASCIARSNHIVLAGIEAYENVFSVEDVETRISMVDLLLKNLGRLAIRLDEGGYLAGTSEVIVSAGSSVFFDRVVEILPGELALSVPIRVVLRCGSYITQDAVTYDLLSPLAGRSTGPERLRQALELWGIVLSRPEPELVVLGFGKRDVAHDRGFPIPIAVRRNGEGTVITDELTILSLNDHHARIRIPPKYPLAPRDLVGFHISHPCTTFDNWRLVPLVDDNYCVLGAVRCYL